MYEDPTYDTLSANVGSDVSTNGPDARDQDDLSPREPDQNPQAQLGQECKDLSTDTSSTPTEPGPDSGIKSTPDNAKAPITYKIIPADPNAPKPEIKRYAHHGKRRRSITEDLFRCTLVTKIVSDSLTCGALLWKNRPSDLRSHLLTHMDLEIVKTMSDDQVLQAYTQAKRIFLECLPDDAVFGLDEEDLDEEDDLELEEED